MVITKDIGMIALAVFLILFGLLTAFNVTFQGQALIMGILALIAGVLILISPGISTRR